MKQSLFTMEHARQLTADTYELVLSGDKIGRASCRERV